MEEDGPSLSERSALGEDKVAVDFAGFLLTPAALHTLFSRPA